MAESEYAKRQESNETVFDVTPASPPKNYVALGMAVLPLLLLLLISKLLVIAVLGLLVWLAFKDWRPVDHRSSSTFRVSATTITSKGREFKKDDIHRLIIKNGVTNDEVGTLIASNAIQPQLAAGLAASHLQRKKMARVANSLDVETGGKAYVLAGGMDETTAFGLLKDVSKALGFGVS